MRLLITSDAHGDEEIFKDLKRQYPNMDYYLDAGDSVSIESEIFPFKSVRGNCDYYPFDDKLMVRTEVGNILIRHLPYLREEEKKNIRIFIHGHTHRRKLYEENGIIYLCPGSVVRPRDDSRGSFAIISINGPIISIDVIETFTKNILTHYEIM